ncbi:MAG: Flp pilus assembly complex ATPase component TadA [Desulfobulbaceae bacterium]|nr:Flp pilus assembly complex ATPase component TadA [Desulfobulbaceae bacterium]
MKHFGQNVREQLKQLTHGQGKQVHPDGDADLAEVPVSLPVCARLEAEDFPESPPEFTNLPVTFMKRFLVLPVEITADQALVVMADPLDFSTREIITRTFEQPVQIRQAEAETISQYIYRWYEAEVDMAADEGEADLDFEDQLWDNPEHLKDMASEAPIIRLVNHLITRAVSLNASDIHIEPRKNHVQIRYRIDGVLHNMESINIKLKSAIISRVKLIAKMDIAEMRLPQDGRIRFSGGGHDIDIRVSSVPAFFGESLVLRLLKQDEINLDLNSLGFPTAILQRFEQAIKLPYGMILVTGPTGSGKTTTLYAALNTLNQPDVKILTVEDPVEYQLDGVNQVQVQPAIGLTFSNALRSFLRQDPDIILVGEIRDVETADIAIQSALTGHMVFSTLHTNDSVGAIARLEDMGVERFMVASAVVGVLAQRLVRRICPECSTTVELSEGERQQLALELQIPVEKVLSRYQRGQGCKTCGGTGYRGRIGIYEYLPFDESVRRAISRGDDLGADMRRSREGGGMSFLRDDGIEKVGQGITTYEEVLRVTR